MGAPEPRSNVSSEDALGVFDGAAGRCTPLTTADVADALECSRRDAERELERLADRGELETKPVGEDAAIWWRPLAAKTAYRQESEYQQFGEFVRAVEDYAIFVLNPDGTVASWNQGAERIKGYDEAEILGEHIAIFYSDEDVEAGRPTRNLELAAAEGRREDEGWRVRKDGTEFWANVIITAIHDDAGELQGFMKVTRDLTEQKHREDELQRERDFTQKLLETAPIGISVQDADGRTTMANQRAQDVLGLSEQEIIDTPDDADEWGVFDADDEPLPPEATPTARARTAGERVFNEEVAIESPDGVRSWFSINAVPVLDGDGDLDRVITAAEDITELKERERQLEQRKSELETELGEILGRISDAFYALDEEWRFTHVNERAEDALLQSADEVLGRCLWDMFPGLEESVVEAEYREAVETQEPTTFEVYDDRLGVWFEINAYPSETGLSAYFRDITERREREQRLERQHTQLRTLNSLNELVHEITHLVIESSTREGIERLVCDHLTDAESYSFAWVGEVDTDHESVKVRTDTSTAADPETVPIDADGGLIGRAVRTREVHVVRDLPSDGTGRSADDDVCRVRELAGDRVVRSVAAVPIEYDKTLYGVLTIYSERRDAFEDDERSVVGRLGAVIGHAINGIERKQALMSDEVVEVRLRVRGVLDGAGGADAAAGRVSFDRTIPVDEATYLQYGTVTREGIATLRAYAETRPHDAVVTIFDEEADESRFELRLAGPPAISTIAAHGGRVERHAVEDGDLDIVIQLPPGADVGRVVELAEAEYPSVELVSKRQTVRVDQVSERLERTMTEGLTPKQRSTIETAYFAGFFEWPRDNSGESVAESLGVSAPTFHQHVRTAERKLLRALFGD